MKRIESRCLMFNVQFYIVRVDAFVGLFCGCGCFGWVDILFMILRLPGGKCCLHGCYLLCLRL